MNEAVAVLGIVLAVVIMLTLMSILQMLTRVETAQKKLENEYNSILRAVSATQSDLRTRMKSDGVEPIIDRPKAEQHYEGRGVKRVTSGGKADPAGGEGTAARISSVKRRSYGGTAGDPAGR